MSQLISAAFARLRAALAAALGASDGDALIGVLTSRTGSVATTQHQVNDEGYNLFRAMTPTQIAAITAAAGAAGAECATALQAALDSGAGALPAPDGRYMIGTPLRIETGTERVAIKGGHRIRTIFSPDDVDISGGTGHGVNALLVIQDNNAHLCIEKARFYSDTGYTGIGIYCKEGGGTDGSGQAMFSGVFRDLWIDFGSTNSGFLTGAVQNCKFDTATCENMKGVFTLEGVGCGDNFFRDYSLFNCFDHFISQVADTNGTFATSVSGIHAYNHQRGRLFQLQNWKGGSIHNTSLEPDAANLGDTGLFKFKDCIGTNVSDFYALTRTGVPACAVGIEIDTHSGKFWGGSINADIGLKLTGAGAVDLDFDGVDFTECTTAALQFAAATTGTLRTRNCKFNDSTLSGILSSVENAVSWYSHDDEFLNAGLGGTAGARNITVASSGEIIMCRPRIGRDNGGAAAAYFIEATGSGTVTLIDPIWVGTPPTGRITGSQTVVIKVTQRSDVAVVTDATYTVDDSDAAVVADRAGTVTLTLPDAAAHAGRRIDLKTHQAQAVVSANSDVVANTGGAAGTAILPAVDGAGGYLIADGASALWQLFRGA